MAPDHRAKTKGTQEMKESVIKVVLRPGMEILSEQKLTRLMMQVMARDFRILGTVTHVSIKEKQ